MRTWRVFRLLRNLGMPLLWPHAWLAFVTMAATIALWLTLGERAQAAFRRRAA